VYGIAPNPFFKKFIDKHKPGSILLPAEGEGRNAIYAASKGWQVDAFDFSVAAKTKALDLAKSKGLSIHYEVKDITGFRAEKLYDAVGLFYVHLPPETRTSFHKEMVNSLKPGGYLVMEAFCKDQVNYNSGGPKDPALLYDTPGICADFRQLHMLNCGYKETMLNEGPFHNGKASIIQLLGQRL
jgi:SAM-dependent methyltransferase